MTILPRISGREAVAVLGKLGYEKDRQKSTHMVLRQTAYPHRRLVVPDHIEVAKGALRAIIKQAGFTVEAFVELVK